MANIFDKPALCWKQQVDLLKERGMEIADSNETEFNLKHLNYYRLRAYWLPFEAHSQCSPLQLGTRFENVLNLYTFDHQLRLIILNAIEHIEVSIRSVWVYNLAHTSGSHGYLYPDLASNKDLFEKNLELLKNEVKRSNEIFIKHYRKTYSESLPSIWVTCAIISFGLLSRWYNNLKSKSIQTAIANTYNIDKSLLPGYNIYR